MADKAPIAGQKIKRKFMGNFIDSALPGTKETAYVRLGKDLEEYNVEMNANVDTKNNILGETSVTLDSYQPQATADPFYAVVGDPMFERLQGSSYGGDTTGYQIPFNVHHTGNRVKGTFALETKTFTPDSE